MTPQELIDRYYLARIIGWRHELELLDAEAVAELVKALKAANNRLRDRIAAELPNVWASYTSQDGGAAIRLWLGELLTESATQVADTITEGWSLSAQSSLAAYNDIISVNGLAKNIVAVPITIDTVRELASKKLFAGYTLNQLVGKAFTEGQIKSVISSLDDSIKKGWGYQKAIKALMGKSLDEGLEVTRRQAITLARSYIQQASVNAQLSVFEANKDVLKGVKWTGILDNRICPLCFVGTTDVIPLGRLRGVSKRPYFGDILTITTASGKKISATPKHPVLTPEGWCALEKLNPGDQVIYAEEGDVLNVLREQEINVPTKFTKLFDFFCSRPFAEIKRYRTAAYAFNGDSGIFHNQVATIGINRFLKDDVGYLALAQHIPYKGFAFDDSSLVFLSGNPALDISFNRMRARAFGLAAPFYSRFFEGLKNKSFFKVLPIHREDVVSIRREYKSCHVYNLHCDEELYLANGFIAKNCASLDGNKYEWGEKRPPMPRHPRCRCLWLPWVKSWRDLGIDKDDLQRAARPWAIREEGNIDEGGNRKVEFFGTTKEDFGGWWKTLKFKQQAQVIGPVRTRLINEGKLTWKDIVDKNSGKYFTLEELGFTEGGKKL